MELSTQRWFKCQPIGLETSRWNINTSPDREAPAPDGLLYVIRCNCKVSSKSPCSGSCCSYRRNGLHYVAAYGDCRGTECQNCDKCEASTDDTDQVRNFYDDACDYLFGNLIFNHYLKLAQLVFYWNVLT